MRTRTVLLTAAILLPLGSQVAFAQDVPRVIDETVLQSLYEAYLANPNNEFILKRIDEERQNIRDIIEEELKKIVTPLPEEEELDHEEFTKAIDRQRSLISALEERLRDRTVDLDLLNSEEKNVYLISGTGTGAGIDVKYRLTESYPELLAKRAILADRIDALTSVIYQQRSRLDKLVTQQRIEQFQVFLNLGQYLLVLILVWLFEKFVRTTILSRIPNPDRRYTATKVFSTSLYTLTILAALAVIFARNPGVLASFAIVGAGIAIALQDLVKDVLGWVLIHHERLYSMGNRISIGKYTGEVVDIAMLRTRLFEVGIPPEGVLEHTGKILSIPNSLVLTEPLTNHSTTSDYVNAEMNFAVTFESDWRKARDIVQQIINDEAGDYATIERKQNMHRTRMFYMQARSAGPNVFIDIVADGVLINARFPVPIGFRRTVVSTIADKILERFNAEPTVELAYQTSRILAEVTDRKKDT